MIPINVLIAPTDCTHHTNRDHSQNRCRVDQYLLGPCTQTNVFNRANDAEGFQNAMAAAGHTSVFDWGDLNAWETDFRSPPTR